MKRVTLERAGTINHDSEDFIKSPNEWRPIEGSLEAIARLAQAGYRIVVATNQSGIARGFFDTASRDGGGWAVRRVFLLPPGGRLGLPLPQAAARDAARGGAALQRLAQGHLHGRRRAPRCRRRGGRPREGGARAHRPRPQDTGRRQPAPRHRGVRESGGVRRAPGSVTLARSILFAAALVIVTPPYALLALATFPLPPMVRYRIISGWSRVVILLARSLLGIRWKVEGHEHLPACPAVILPQHRSAGRTLAFTQIFPPQVHVLKRELLWIPFFGWGLALMSPIPIDRARGVSALRSIARSMGIGL